MIQNLQCCFLGHKQFPGNQHKPQVNIAEGEGGGEGGAVTVKECSLLPLIRHFSHLFKAKQNFLI